MRKRPRAIQTIRTPLTGLRDRALAGFDVPQRLSFFGVWDLPFLRNCKELVCKVVGGWQFSGYGVLEKGNPFSVYTTAVYPRGDFNADNLAYDFPNAPTTSLTKSWNRTEFMQGIFTASQFPLPSAGTVGNLGPQCVSRTRFRPRGLVARQELQGHRTDQHDVTRGGVQRFQPR